MADYVRALARRGVAALLLELGRTFPSAPPTMVAAARDTGLPLVVLHGVVPFIQVTQTVHPLLLDDELQQLRRHGPAPPPSCTGPSSPGPASRRWWC